jgi:hypothetical protein
MRRRDFIALGSAAIAWPRAAQASEMRRLAVLTTFGDSDALAQGSVRFRASSGRVFVSDALPQRPDHVLHDQRVLPAVR